MKKSGRTAAGAQRWKCTICNASTTAATSAAPGPRSGPSRQEVADLELFVSRDTSASSQIRLNRSGFDGGGDDGKDHCHGTEEVLVGAARAGDSDGVGGEGRRGVNRIARLPSPSGRFPGADMVPHPSMDSPGMIPDMTWPTVPGCLSRPAGPCRRGARPRSQLGSLPPSPERSARGSLDPGSSRTRAVTGFPNPRNPRPSGGDSYVTRRTWGTTPSDL